jgi:DNA replication and repair protein RecF
MLLESLEAHQFRNLSGTVFWGNGLNFIFGDNGQGKTNWLEAIYLLATTKSFRTQRPQEAVKFDENLSVLRGCVRRSSEVHRDLQVAIQGNVKTLAVNGKRANVADYLRQLHVVSFTAEDLEVVRGGPEARRRFLDRGVISLHHSYIQALADYQRVVKQKNRLLQDLSESESPLGRASEMLGPWNEQLALLSVVIHQARTDYVNRLQDHLQKRLFGREEVTIRYVSALEGKGDLNSYGDLIRERLQLRLQAEMAAGYSLVGPHKDDLEMLFDGREIRAFGSSGQQRSALILLDLAAVSVYHSFHREYPLFLLDDVDAELDMRRIRELIEHLRGRTQTFITTSKESLINDFSDRSEVFEVVGGAARVVTPSRPGATIETAAESI